MTGPTIPSDGADHEGHVVADVADVAAAVAEAHRTEWGRIVAGLISRTGDWSLAEDATQDAFAAALATWPRDGIPRRPGAWLTTTARHRAIDRLRSSSAAAARAKEAGMDLDRQRSGDDDHDGHGHDDDGHDDDGRLRLIFTCCHPALPLAARVALTLRTVSGLPVEEIARTFLVPEATMAQRLVRARRKIEHAAIPYRVPPPELLEERLSGVLAVLYLAFNAGYGDARFAEVAASATRLAEAVVDLMPRESEARGLLALMLLQGSRRDARVDAAGELLTIEEQDRSRWRHEDIDRATTHLRSARQRGPYVLQALIARCHAVAPSAAATDWTRIVTLYDELLVATPSPVIALNRAVAVGMSDGPDVGLAALDALGDSLDGFRLLPAARADLLQRAGRLEEAAAHYRDAIALAATDAERRQLTRRLDHLAAPP